MSRAIMMVVASVARMPLPTSMAYQMELRAMRRLRLGRCASTGCSESTESLYGRSDARGRPDAVDAHHSP